MPCRINTSADKKPITTTRCETKTFRRYTRACFGGGCDFYRAPDCGVHISVLRGSVRNFGIKTGVIPNRQPQANSIFMDIDVRNYANFPSAMARNLHPLIEMRVVDFIPFARITEIRRAKMKRQMQKMKKGRSAGLNINLSTDCAIRCHVSKKKGFLLQPKRACTPPDV